MPATPRSALSATAPARTVPLAALAINDDGTRLLAGYAGGQVTRWDLESGKALNTFSSVHPRGVAVTSVAFTDDHTCALSLDALGSLYMHTFKRRVGLRTADHACLFEGK